MVLEDSLSLEILIGRNDHEQRVVGRDRVPQQTIVELITTEASEQALRQRRTPRQGRSEAPHQRLVVGRRGSTGLVVQRRLHSINCGGGDKFKRKKVSLLVVGPARQRVGEHIQLAGLVLDSEVVLREEGEPALHMLPCATTRDLCGSRRACCQPSAHKSSQAGTSWQGAPFMHQVALLSWPQLETLIRDDSLSSLLMPHQGAANSKVPCIARERANRISEGQQLGLRAYIA